MIYFDNQIALLLVTYCRSKRYFTCSELPLQLPTVTNS